MVHWIGIRNIIPLGLTTESHKIRNLFPERSFGKVPVALAVATTTHFPFKESIFPENSVIWGLLFYIAAIQLITRLAPTGLINVSTAKSEVVTSYTQSS